MPSTTYKQRRTPGVYITELDAFPPSIVGVQTAVPGFIGYTQTAEISGKPIYYKPIAISSMVDFESIFGGGFKRVYDIEEVPGSPAPDPDSYDFMVEGGSPVQRSYYKLTPVTNTHYNLYESMRLFFDNGGGNAYVVSVGEYTDQGVELDPLKKGLASMGEQVGPTMLAIPDAVLLPSNGATIPDTDLPTSASFATLVQKMMAQCYDLQDRVAILDVYGTQALKQDLEESDGTAVFDIDLNALIQQFREDVGTEYLNYGMGYFPFLNTSVIQPNEIDYTYLNIGDGDTATWGILRSILEEQAAELYGVGTPKYDQAVDYINDMDPTTSPGGVDPTDTQAVTTLNNNLVNAVPLLQQIENLIAGKANVLPPSGAMAGVYTRIDQSRGVWNAPANTSLTSVVAPTVKINDNQQGDLNVPLDGKAVDAIREFPGRGTVVWGARTLDGNSNDWRYIQVRRTLIYIEQSVKAALDPFVFAANDGNTWTTVKSMVSNFLQGLWSQGGLFGATADEAFTVEVGLGSTMTAEDILNGYMIVQITLQLIRPAEFIELTFKQKMDNA